MLEPNPAKRPTCDQLLKVPIIARNAEKWSQPISEAEKKELIQNYINSTSFDAIRETPQDVLRFADEKQKNQGATRPMLSPSTTPRPTENIAQAKGQTISPSVPTPTATSTDNAEFSKQQSNTIDDKKGVMSENPSFMKQNTIPEAVRKPDLEMASTTQLASNRGSFVSSTGERFQTYQLGTDGNLANTSAPIASNYGTSTPQRLSHNPDFKLFSQTPPNTTRETSREPTFRRYVIDQSPILLKTEIGAPANVFGQYVKNDSTAPLNQTQNAPVPYQQNFISQTPKSGQDALTKRFTAEEASIQQVKSFQQNSRPPSATSNPPVSQNLSKEASLTQPATKPYQGSDFNRLIAEAANSRTHSTEPAKRVIYIESSKNRIISSISEQKEGATGANYEVKTDSKFEQKLALESNESQSANTQVTISAKIQKNEENSPPELKTQQNANKSISFLVPPKNSEYFLKESSQKGPSMRPISASEKQPQNQLNSQVKESHAGKNVIFENVKKWAPNPTLIQPANHKSLEENDSQKPNQDSNIARAHPKQTTINDQNVRLTAGNISVALVSQGQNHERNSMYQFTTSPIIDAKAISRPSMETPQKNIDLSPSGTYRLTANAQIDEKNPNAQRASPRTVLESPPAYPRLAAPPNTPVLNAYPPTSNPIPKKDSFRSVLEVDFASALLSKTTFKPSNPTSTFEETPNQPINSSLKPLPQPVSKKKDDQKSDLASTPRNPFEKQFYALPAPNPKQTDKRTASKNKSEASPNRSKQPSKKNVSRSKIGDSLPLDSSITFKNHKFSPQTSIRTAVNKDFEKDPKKFPPVAKGDKPAAQHPNVTFVDYFEHKKYQTSGQKPKAQNDFRDTHSKPSPYFLPATHQAPVTKTEAKALNEPKLFPQRKESSKSIIGSSGRLADTSAKNKGNKSSSRIMERADVSRNKVKNLLVDIENYKLESLKKIETENPLRNDNQNLTNMSNSSPTKQTPPEKNMPSERHEKHYVWNDFADIQNTEVGLLTKNRRGIDVKVISRERSAQRRPEFKTLDETIGLKVKQPDVFGNNLKWEE